MLHVLDCGREDLRPIGTDVVCEESDHVSFAWSYSDVRGSHEDIHYEMVRPHSNRGQECHVCHEPQLPHPSEAILLYVEGFAIKKKASECITESRMIMTFSCVNWAACTMKISAMA